MQGGCRGIAPLPLRQSHTQASPGRLKKIPNAWGIGMHCPLSHMRVRDAAARMLVLEAMAGVAGYALGAGVRPRLWADPALPDVGMAALERRLASRLLERLVEQQAHAVARGRRRRRDTSGDDDDALYDAPWMHPSRPRAHPLQRAAAAQAAAAALAPLPPPGPRVSDCVDVAALPPARAPPSWRAAYVSDRGITGVARPSKHTRRAQGNSPVAPKTTTHTGIPRESSQHAHPRQVTRREGNPGSKNPPALPWAHHPGVPAQMPAGA
jgi:hypothetical protein